MSVYANAMAQKAREQKEKIFWRQDIIKQILKEKEENII